MKNGSQIKADIAVLIERTERTEENVKKILENHLPHLQEEISSLKLQMAMWSGAITVVVWLLNKYL